MYIQFGWLSLSGSTVSLIATLFISSIGKSGRHLCCLLIPPLGNQQFCVCVLARLGSFVSAQGLVPLGSLVSVLDNAQSFNSLSFRASATGPARLGSFFFCIWVGTATLGTFMLILGDASVES